MPSQSRRRGARDPRRTRGERGRQSVLAEVTDVGIADSQGPKDGGDREQNIPRVEDSALVTLGCNHGLRRGGAVNSRSFDTTASRLKSTSAVEIVEFGRALRPCGDRGPGLVGSPSSQQRGEQGNPGGYAFDLEEPEGMPIARPKVSVARSVRIDRLKSTDAATFDRAANLGQLLTMDLPGT